MIELLARIDSIGIDVARQVGRERQPPRLRASSEDRYQWLFWALGRSREITAETVLQ